VVEGVVDGTLFGEGRCMKLPGGRVYEAEPGGRWVDVRCCTGEGFGTAKGAKTAKAMLPYLRVLCVLCGEVLLK
jgi:hypothetical protein